MQEYTSAERKIDWICMVAFPSGFIILAMLAYLGYSPAFFGDSYVFMTELVSAAVVMVLPAMRLTRKFRSPYWFMAVVTTVPYLHAVSLYFGFYKDFAYWDFIAHCYSSIVVTMVVFIALLIINHYTTRIHLSRGGILTGTILIGHGFGIMWEMWEWFIDILFNDSYMSYDVMDTIKDVCLGDAAGVTIMFFAAFLYMRYRDCDKIVDGMNLGGFMEDMGRRWDRKCINEDPGAENDSIQ